MEIHPMKGDVGFLGGYFDDNGINIYHDEWFCPMSATTSAILEIALNSLVQTVCLAIILFSLGVSLGGNATFWSDLKLQEVNPYVMH